MSPLSKKRARVWTTVIWIAAGLTVIITFSPVILHHGKKDPSLLSLPFSLWGGMMTTVILVLLAYLSSKIRDKY
jgi:hypothetical protein